MLSSGYVRMNIKLLKAKFSWTYYGFIRLNLIMVTTLVFTWFSKGASIEKFFAVLPTALAIINAVIFFILPFADLYEQYKDKKMCSILGVDYEEEYLLRFEDKIKDTIRNNFKNSTKQSSVKLSDLVNKKIKS